MVWIWFLFFLLSISSAWYIGFRYSSFSKQKIELLPRDYLMGLHFVMNEEKDKAIDLFSKLIELDGSAVDLQLTVAAFFRKQGEIDRAIRIHQNILSRSKLPEGVRENVLYELGQDYFHIGLLDRAEKIFLELLIIPAHQQRVHHALMLLYQQEKNWEKAIQASMLYAKTSGENMSKQIAQFYCERADFSFREHDQSSAWMHVESALATDPACVRAHFLSAKLSEDLGDHKSALRVLKRIAHDYPDYLPEAIKEIVRCYKKLNREDRMLLYFKRLMNDYPNVPILLMMLPERREFKGDPALFEQLKQYIQKHPSLSGLYALTVSYLDTATGQLKQDLTVFVDLMQAVLSREARFRCGNCGFGSRSLYWQCPSCKEWCTLKPEVN